MGEWLRPFLPSPRLVLLLAPPAVAYTLAVSWLAGWLRTRKGVRTPYTRKLFHFCIFTLAGIVQLIWGLPGVTTYGSVASLRVLYAVWRGDGDPFYEAIARPSDAPRRTLFIVIPLLTTALGGVLSNLFFAPFGYVGYLVCGWGDAVGEPVGTRWGRHRYRVRSLSRVPATRSLEGSGAVFALGALAASLGLFAGGLEVGTALLVGLAASLAGTLVEAVSNHGLDNLTTQVAASAVAFLLLRS
jgi:phytol kinase